jgi:cell division protein FtsW
MRTAQSHSTRPPGVTQLLVSISLLALIGLLFIYSSSSAFALSRHGSAHYFVVRQGYGLLLALGAALCVSRIPFTVLLDLSNIIFILTICANGLLLITPHLASAIHGSTIHGSTRWLSLFGISFQPSELLKGALLVRCSALMGRRNIGTSERITHLMPIGITLGVAIVSLLLQPDFGQALLITLTLVCQLFIAHPYLGYFRMLALPVLAGAVGLIIRAPYRLRRIVSFLNPWADPHGAGFQIIQSQIAIGAGGIIGRGIGCSNQKFFYLPMQHTDFIFSIIAEETGLWGVTCILTLYLVLLWSGLRLAWRTTYTPARLFISSATIITTLQASINLAVATGLAPTKGIGLPWVSYGISSLVGNGILLGGILSAARAQHMHNQR